MGIKYVFQQLLNLLGLVSLSGCMLSANITDLNQAISTPGAGTNLVPMIAPNIQLVSDSITSNQTITLKNLNCDNEAVAILFSESATQPLVNDSAWQVCGIQNYNFSLSNGEGAKTVYAYLKNSAQTISSHSSVNVLLDQTAPSITQALINNNAASTSNRFFDIQFSAAEVQTAGASTVKSICIKAYSDTDPLPTAPANINDTCWVSLLSVGIVPLATMTNVTYSNFLVSAYATQVFSVRVWAADAAGNISASYQQDSINFIQPVAGTLTNVQVGGVDGITYPAADADMTVSMSSSAYIKWKAVAGTAAFSANPVKIYYTQDNFNWTEIDSLTVKNNGVNGSCTVDANYSGCYVWTNSVSSSYLKFRVEVTNTDGVSLVKESPWINKGNFRQIAGNTSLGVGGVASKAIFLPYSGAPLTSLAVTKSKVVYFNIANQGIVQIKPTDGKVRLVVKYSSGAAVDGAVGTATITSTPNVGMAIDTQDRLVFIELGTTNRIRRYDPVADTVTTIAGGGAGTTSGILATTMNLTNSANCNPNTLLYIDKNDNVYFLWCTTQALSNVRLAKYDNSDQKIYLTAFTASEGYYSTGGSATYTTGFDVSSYGVAGWFLKFDSSGLIDRVTLTARDLSGTPRRYWTMTFDSTGAMVPQANAIRGAYGTGLCFPTLSNLSGLSYGLCVPTYVDAYRLDLSLAAQWQQIKDQQVGISADGSVFSSSSTTINPSAWYLSADSIVYFVENGKLRYIDANGKLQSFYGEYTYDGDGSVALEARYGYMPFIDLRTNGNIIISDTSSRLMREVDLTSGNSIKLAGDLANDYNVSTAVLAVNTHFGGASNRPVIYNSNDDSIFTNASFSSYNGLAKLSNTGYFSKVAFGVTGSAPTYYSFSNPLAEGMNLLNVICNPMIDGAFPLAYSAERNVVLYRMAQYDSSYNVVNMMFAELDFNTNTFHKFMGLYSSADGQSPYTQNIQSQSSNIVARGSVVSTSLAPTGLPAYAAQWDNANPGANQGPRWVTFARDGAGNRKRLLGLPIVGGGTVQDITTTTLDMKSSVYVRKAPNNILYYCVNETSPRLVKRTITDETTGAGSEAFLSLPPGISCSGNVLRWNATRNTVVFSFLQNGVYGVAEYYDP